MTALEQAKLDTAVIAAIADTIPVTLLSEMFPQENAALADLAPKHTEKRSAKKRQPEKKYAHSHGLLIIYFIALMKAEPTDPIEEYEITPFIGHIRETVEEPLQHMAIILFATAIPEVSHFWRSLVTPLFTQY